MQNTDYRYFISSATVFWHRRQLSGTVYVVPYVTSRSNCAVVVHGVSHVGVLQCNSCHMLSTARLRPWADAFHSVLDIIGDTATQHKTTLHAYSTDDNQLYYTSVVNLKNAHLAAVNVENCPSH